jgi:hypothetical protein
MIHSHGTKSRIAVKSGISDSEQYAEFLTDLFGNDFIV